MKVWSNVAKVTSGTNGGISFKLSTPGDGGLKLKLYCYREWRHTRQLEEQTYCQKASPLGHKK